MLSKVNRAQLLLVQQPRYHLGYLVGNAESLVRVDTLTRALHYNQKMVCICVKVWEALCSAVFLVVEVS